MFFLRNFSESLGTTTKQGRCPSNTDQCNSSSNSLAGEPGVARERVNSNNVQALLCAQPELAYTTK